MDLQSIFGKLKDSFDLFQIKDEDIRAWNTQCLSLILSDPSQIFIT